MGLRLVAHYYDRNEALIAISALDAAGLAGFLINTAQISVQPFHEVALGGFRLMVVEEELDDAVGVLREARKNPLLTGERLSKNHRTGAFVALHLSQFLLLGGFLLIWPLRTYRWHEVVADSR
jgi:hypothetical protein